MPARKKRRITAEDLYRIELIGGIRISPDGRHVVYTLRRVDRKTEKKYSNLWLVPTDKGRPRQFTYGDHVDAQPRWSPDGKSIAFISNRDDLEQPQIYIIALDGGEARKLTNLKGDFGAFEWSLDGKQLVCEFRKKDKEAIERESDEQKKKLGIVSRHIMRVMYELDGEGFLPNERTHIWTINTRSGRAKQLTDSEMFDESQPSWSPDGKSIVFRSNHSPDPDFDPGAVDLFVIAAKGGRMRKIDTPIGPKELPAFSPDGKSIAYYGQQGQWDWWRNNSLWIVPTDGKVKARNLTAQYDIDISVWTINDIPMIEFVPPTWSNDGKTIYFQTAERGNTLLRSVSTTGKDLCAVIEDTGVVGWFGFDREQKTLAYFFGEMLHPGQVWVRDVAGATSRRLTDVNDRLLKSIDLGSVEEVWFKGPADNDLQGWILKPPGFSKTKKYAAILEIHGGPLVQYGNLFMHEFLFLAAHDYVVFFSNPRGGRGYGEAHGKAIWGAWGTADYDDVVAWTDEVVRRPYVDAKRLGVTGGSYGGFMTNWIIGHTDRFKAAVTQRSVTNMITSWGASDINWAFQVEIGENKPPWENFDHYWEQSPMKYLGNAKTPTLVIHSEQDLRCYPVEGEQVFTALKKLGIDTELVRFPDESHGLSRGGRTDRRIARLKHILRWFDKYLK